MHPSFCSTSQHERHMGSMKAQLWSNIVSLVTLQCNALVTNCARSEQQNWSETTQSFDQWEVWVDKPVWPQTHMLGGRHSKHFATLSVVKLENRMQNLWSLSNHTVRNQTTHNTKIWAFQWQSQVGKHDCQSSFSWRFNGICSLHFLTSVQPTWSCDPLTKCISKTGSHSQTLSC